MHDTAATVEAEFLAMRERQFFDQFEIVIEYQVDSDALFEGHRNCVLSWMDANGLNRLPFVHLAQSFAGDQCTSSEQPPGLIALPCLPKTSLQ